LRLWEQTVAAHPESVALWGAYIAFRQSHFKSFTITDMRALFSTAIHTLSHMDAPAMNRERAVLDMFIQACMLEKQAGYIERAIACFQALIEFNCFAPDDVSSFEQKLALFAAFWDSDTLRIGEKGAMGWEHWLSITGKHTTHKPVLKPQQPSQQSSGGQWIHLGTDYDDSTTMEPSASDTNMIPSIDIQAPFEMRLLQWLKEERKQQEQRSLPRRTTESTPDPDCIVLWDDIRGYLFNITSPALRLELLFRFFHFLGVNVPQHFISSDVHLRAMVNAAEDTGEMIAACGHGVRELDLLCDEVLRMKNAYQLQSMDGLPPPEFAMVFSNDAHPPLQKSPQLHNFIR